MPVRTLPVYKIAPAQVRGLAALHDRPDRRARSVAGQLDPAREPALGAAFRKEQAAGNGATADDRQPVQELGVDGDREPVLAGSAHPNRGAVERDRGGRELHVPAVAACETGVVAVDEERAAVVAS
jgi:hypothetical protein